MRKELHLKVSVSRSICPDIYHPAVARDGLLTRLRFPGGILTSKQCLVVAELLEATGVGDVRVTNRANLQIRGLDADIPPEHLQMLIAEKLISADKAVDGNRNIMASPLAGIDPTELIDVRPLVAAWDEYLSDRPELGVLSNKFSVGFDGGGSVSILDRPNDITLLAIADREFLLHLALGERGEAPVSTGVLVDIEECISVLGAIAEEYRRGSGGRAVRLREVLRESEGFLLRLGVHFTQRFALVGFPDVKSKSRQRGTEGTQRCTEEEVCRHLGVWGQRQAGLSYVGVVLRLGRIDASQLHGLAEIAARYGSGEMRLTPWQNAIVPDVRDEDVAAVLGAIDGLGLKTGANDLNGLLTACAGASGCKFAAGDTQGDAIELSKYVAERLELDRPLNIHFSGCDKSCAQHYQADIALWGCPPTAEREAGYRLCVGGGDDKFGRELRDYLTPEDVRLAIDRLIRAYQEQRLGSQESFRAFTDRQSLVQLQQVF
jgi:ferredoxin-nitrite reductase